MEAFSKLPEMLHHVTYSHLGQYGLYFYEQGTDLNLLIKNRNSHIELLLKKYEYSRFDHLPNKKLLVSKHEFCRNWIKFIRKVLKEVEEEYPGCVTDESFEDYEDAIAGFEALMT